MSESDRIKKQLKAKKESPPPELLSSGSALVNLASSGRVDGALAKGQFCLLVGASQSGKSWLARSFLAEASINPLFDSHSLIYDDPENGSWMDTERFFGAKLARRLRPMRGTREEPRASTTVEEFYDGLDDLYKSKKPFVYVLDSENALTSEKDEEHFQKNKTLRDADKNAAGDYSMHKAKCHSHNLNSVANVKLRETDSILIMISQSRQRIGFGAQFNPDTRSGGTALKFFAHLEIWTKIREDIKTDFKGKPRQLGIRTKIKVEKSRLTGREGSVEIPIYWSSGIDDVGGTIDWLLEEKYWKKAKGIEVIAPEYGFEGEIELLVKKIQGENLEPLLYATAQKCWDEIQGACSVERKNRYS